MANSPDYVQVVYQGDAASTRAFGIDFGKGIPVLVTKPIADRLLDTEEHTGFALHEHTPAADPSPAPTAPAEPVAPSATEHTPASNKDEPQPKEA